MTRLSGNIISILGGINPHRISEKKIGGRMGIGRNSHFQHTVL